MSSTSMAEIRASFFVECEELLEALQDGLTAMDAGSSDEETVNVCFRAVHSIKGGAGAFGLDDLVSFAHSFETVMDAIRSKKLTASPDIAQTLLRAADILADLVLAARDNTEADSPAIDSMVNKLDAIAGADDDLISADDFTPQSLSIDSMISLDDFEIFDELEDKIWTIEFRPLPSLFALGNEPIFLFRTLASLGEVTIEPQLDAVPLLEDHDPESACLWWTLTLKSEAHEDEIRDIFDFVDGLCDLTIEVADEEATDATVPAQPDPAPDPGEEQASGVPPAAATPPAKVPEQKKTTIPRDNTSQPYAVKATVRVDLERIDRLVNLVGELVINQAMLSQSVVEAGLTTNSTVSQGLEEFLQLTRDIQDSVMMIRAQPVKTLFQRMSRIVREASISIDKSVRLLTEGDTTEVDKTVIERLADPLTHMIRNAVDHGLESTEARIAAGKPPHGTIALSAAHKSGRVIIEIADDGSGIDRSKIKDLAIDKGLIPADAQLSDSEIDGLIFLPGFSTASVVTDLSGRGVGMDVVRSAIQDLSGRISIESRPGEGTTFSISLPLTLAVLDGMVVRTAGETLVMPLSSIQETLSLEDNEIRNLGPETSVLHVRDSFVPLLDLGAELGFREPLDSYEGHVVLLIAQENGTRAALIVDSIEEQRQVVIKGLQDSYGHVHGIAAATILGDGQVALILDPIDLMANATGRTRRLPIKELAG